MGIPELQLETWSHQGAVTTAKITYESIRTALESYNQLTNISYDPYLQGSYKNDTNIRSDMDVDVVIQLNSIFYSNLTEEQKKIFKLGAAYYTLEDFRKVVVNALVDYYDQDQISEGNKAIKVKTLYLPADVVVCYQYRQYPPNPERESDFVEGIVFWTRNEGHQVINYPKPHYENGVRKHQNTANRYKPTVRMFKNIRNYLEEHSFILEGSVPSYFLECLLYNVPDEKFDNSFPKTFCNVVNWLAEEKLDNFVCQNEQVLLFGNTPEQWTAASAEAFIKSAINLWKDW
jgi:hypothetical protein